MQFNAKSGKPLCSQPPQADVNVFYFYVVKNPGTVMYNRPSDYVELSLATTLSRYSDEENGEENIGFELVVEDDDVDDETYGLCPVVHLSQMSNNQEGRQRLAIEQIKRCLDLKTTPSELVESNFNLEYCSSKRTWRVENIGNPQKTLFLAQTMIKHGMRPTEKNRFTESDKNATNLARILIFRLVLGLPDIYLSADLTCVPKKKPSKNYSFYSLNEHGLGVMQLKKETVIEETFPVLGEMLLQCQRRLGKEKFTRAIDRIIGPNRVGAVSDQLEKIMLDFSVARVKIVVVKNNLALCYSPFFTFL